MATQEELWTREFLKSKGIADDNIGWKIGADKKSGTVTVGGKDFMNVTYGGGGKTYADRSALETAWNKLNPVQAASVPSSQSKQPQMNYGNEIASLAQELRNRLNQQPAQFNYNPQSDPQYAAALARAQSNIQQGNSMNMAEMNRRGILNSTITSDRGSQIASKEMGDVERNIVPALVQQAYQRFMNEQAQQQQGYNNMIGLLETFAGQDQRGLDNSYRDQVFNRGIIESDRNFDRSVLESDRNFNRGSMESDRAYNRGVLESDRNFAYQQARDQIADARYKREFDEDARRYGLDYALQKQVQLGNLDISRMNAQTNADELKFRQDQSLQQQQQASQVNIDEEKRGLADAIRSGQLTPAMALQQIEEDVQLGFYSSADAQQLKEILKQLAPTAPTPQPTKEQQKAQEDFQANMPTDKEIESEAIRLGYPTLDYRSYYKDPKGKSAGVTYERWKQLYGPKMSAPK